MKRRISDMLDQFPAKPMEMELDTPLSSERIRDLTMSRVNNQSKKVKRPVFRLLVAAAVIAALGLSAVAAEEIFGVGDAFREILNRKLKENQAYIENNDMDMVVRETISEGQIEVVNKLGESFQEQSETYEGTTMTLTAAYGDAHVIHLYFRVEAPEGTVMPDGILYKFNNLEEDFDGDGHADLLTLAEDAPYEKAGQFVDIEPLPDDDPADNRKEFHVTIKCQSGLGMAFNDGVTKYLHVNGIFEQVVDVDGDEDACVQIAPANFAFDIGLVNDVRIVELDVKGITYGGPKTRTWTHDSPCIALCEENLTGESDPESGLPIHAESWDYSVTVKSLSISSLSADWECEWICDKESLNFGVSFQVIMKDGTSVMNLPGDGHYGDNWASGTVLFATPIDLDEVDYILIGDRELGDTCKIYLHE